MDEEGAEVDVLGVVVVTRVSGGVDDGEGA